MANKVHLIGNMGSDVEIHNFENGNKVGKFSLATNESYKNKQTGETITDTQWHNIVVYNKTAEILEKYTTKGDKLAVYGKIKNRSYESNGETKYITEINVNEFEFITTKKSNNTNVNNPTDENDLPF